MKTAEEWVAEALTGSMSHLTEEDSVRLIQADALRHAASICGEMIPDGYASTCQELIEKEAKGLDETHTK